MTSRQKSTVTVCVKCTLFHNLFQNEKTFPRKYHIQQFHLSKSANKTFPQNNASSIMLETRSMIGSQEDILSSVWMRTSSSKHHSENSSNVKG